MNMANHSKYIEISEREHENSLRINILSSELSNKIKDLCPQARVGLDIGCQTGQITERIYSNTGISFYCIEPDPNCVVHASKKIKALQGVASNLPFEDSSFDIVTIISVIEHIHPKDLLSSFYEIFRVLKPSGYCIGQIPNMNFPIEIHSRLPFQQFLPRKIGDKYLATFSKIYKKSEWYRTDKKRILRLAMKVGFKEITVIPFLYPKYVIPKKFQPFYWIISVFPLDYIFWFRKP